MQKDALERVARALNEARAALKMAMDECDATPDGHLLFVALNYYHASLTEDYRIKTTLGNTFA